MLYDGIEKKILAPDGFVVSSIGKKKNGYTLFVADSGKANFERRVTDAYWYFDDHFDYLKSTELQQESLGRSRQIKCQKKAKGLPPSEQPRYFTLDKGFYSFSELVVDALGSEKLSYIGCLANDSLVQVGAVSLSDVSYLTALYSVHSELFDCYFNKVQSA